ncbi:MAG: ATP-binding protein [Mycobacterium sp.]|nr:ATP-binding protein [Mycobacterium sp.]
MPDPAAGLIGVVGGESTGKSTLAAALGMRLPAVVVPEYLRTWVEHHRGQVPQPGEQAEIMAAHRAAEVSGMLEAERSGLSWVVSDSGPLMTAVYSIQYYDDPSLLPLAIEWTAHNDLILWCQDDFPWQPDPQRDGSHARATSQQLLAEIFAAHPEVPMLEVRGAFDERIETIMDAVRPGRAGSG